MIKITGLDKFFNKGRKNELHVLNGINLSFEEKGLVCILGESGSGKTTLLNTIGGLDTFSGGEIQIEDTVLKQYDPKEVERLRSDKFGYIFQNYYLLQDYTVAYNVRLALNTFPLSDEEKDQRVDYALEKLDMLRYKKKLVSQLSGGQQQRVSIARALVKSPKIILADEPTGNLDEENTLRTMSILKNISKDCLVILVSHEKRVAHFFADRIIEIRDGRILKDYQNQSQDAYERMDDGNIYLRDMEKLSLQDTEQYAIDLYQDESSREQKLRLNLAWKDGKLYIQNLSDCEVLLEGEEIGCQMLDCSKPNVEKEEVEKFEFSLPYLNGHQEAKLGRHEIWKMALENIRLMGKKQAFVMGILLVTAVLMTITLANFTNNFFYDKWKVQKADSHYVTVKASVGYQVDQQSYNEAFKKFCEKYAFTEKNGELYKTSGEDLTLYYNGFRQLNDQGVSFSDASFVSSSHLKKTELVYGRMPEKSSEIVMDKWLIDVFFKSDSPFRSLYKEYTDFLGMTLEAKITGDTFTLVGICDKNEPSIYMSQTRAMGIGVVVTGYNGDSTGAQRIMTLKELQQEYPGKYDSLTLKDHEVLVRASEEKTMDSKEIYMANGAEYKVVGSYADDVDIDYVVNDASAIEIRNAYILNTKGYQVYTDNPEKTISELKNAAKAPEYSDYFRLKVTSEYKQELAQFHKKQRENINTRNLVSVAAVFLALFAIYFTVKSNVSSRMEELTVYRLIGISKRSIIQAYLVEMFLVSTYTILPAVLVTTGILQFIGSVPSLELSMHFPGWTALLLIAILYAMNLLISILPVRNILSKPPAQLAVKS